MALFHVADAAAKTMVLLLMIALASMLARKRPAADRHLLWTTALYAVLVLPALEFLFPAHLHIPIFAAHAAPAFAGPFTPQNVDAAPPHLAFGPVVISSAASVWLAGAVLVMARWLVGQWGLRRWRQTAQTMLSPAWLHTARRESRGILRSLRLLESANIDSPCTWGFFRPTVLLPAAGAAWSESERRCALRHELAHVRRGDWLNEFVSCLACALHWYNPLVWFAAGQRRRLAEQSCDDFVLQSGAAATEYAQFLLDLTGRSVHALPSHACGMARRSAMHGRILALLDDGARRELGATRAAMLLLLPIGAAAFFALAAASPLAAEQLRLLQPRTIAPSATPAAGLHALPALPALPAIKSLPHVPAPRKLPAVPALRGAANP
jgi:beta-lactamase regulating signal transducer with metallopeptidase domain